MSEQQAKYGKDTTYIVKHKLTDNFTILPNELLENEELTWEARGILSYLLSKPTDWEVRKYDLINQSPAGDYVIRRILKELENTNYIKRVRYHGKDGQWRWHTFVYDTPQKDTIPQSPTDGKPTDGSPTDGKPHDILSTDVPSTDVPSTEVNSCEPEKTSPSIEEKEEEALAGLRKTTKEISGVDPQEAAKKKSDGYSKEGILKAMAKGIEKSKNVKAAFREHLKMTPNWDTKTNQEHYQFFRAEIEKGRHVSKFASWWFENDWRGKEGQHPTMNQVRTKWLQAFEEKSKQIPQGDYRRAK